MFAAESTIEKSALTIFSLTSGVSVTTRAERWEVARPSSHLSKIGYVPCGGRRESDPLAAFCAMGWVPKSGHHLALCTAACHHFVFWLQALVDTGGHVLIGGKYVISVRLPGA